MLWKESLKVLGFGLTKIPLILFVAPRVIELSGTRCVVRIPLNYRTRNHLGSMYFGTLAIGADLAGGLAAMKHIEDRQAKVSLVFKDFHADFLKRPDADVDFVCENMASIAELVDRTLSSDERQNAPVEVNAVCKGEVVARMTLTLSLKRRDARA